MIKNYMSKLKQLTFLAVATVLNLTAQQTYTFTTASNTGRLGPSQSQLNTAYASTNLSGSVTSNAGIQTFVVPAGVYRIAAWGAQGGNCGSNSGGLGAKMQGDFVLNSTTTLNIIVGQIGENISYNTGGGGGSFVWITGQPQPLIAAGGGGGGGFSNAGVSAVITTSGTPGTSSAGTPGTGGNGANPGGGGWLSDGTSFMGSSSCSAKCSGNSAGLSVGGASCTATILYQGCAGTSQTGDGGFGGGSGGNGNCTSSYGGGGGGGYSGGVGQSGSSAGGGGGGSYNAGTNQVNTAGSNSGDGLVVITELCSVKVSSSSTGTNSPAILCSGNSLTLTTDAVSNYSWSTGQTTSSIVVAPTSNTVYSLYGTSAQNCNATGVMSVIVSAAPPVLSISNPSNNICLGRTVSLTASGAITYTWANAGVVNGQAFTPSSTDVYTVSGQNGCGITVGTTTITVAPLPVTTLVTPTLICQGYPATLTAVSSVGNYTWEPGTQTGAITYVAPTANTIYTVTASDGTCSGTQTVLLTTQTTPTISLSQTLTTICEGETVILSASGAGVGGTYSWSSGGTGSSISLTPASSSAITVSGTNSLNCTSTAQQIIIVDLPPPLTVSANKLLVCTGDPIVLTGAGATTYQWVNGPATANYTVNQTAATTVYTITGAHATNTCVATQTIATSAIIPNVSATSSIAVCDGSSATFTASGATTYTWNGFNTGSTGVYQVTPLASGIYTLIAKTTSATVNCITTQFASLTVNPNPTITVSPGKETICRGETHTLTATGASTYSWSGSTSTGSVITVKPNSSTNYTITGTDQNGCENTIFYIAKVSICTGIESRSQESGISIYPNPNKGEFVVATQSEITLKVMNSIGQEVRNLELSANNNFKVQVSDLSTGVYFIVGENAEGKVNQKVIITK